jgi:hypothetical protein
MQSFETILGAAGAERQNRKESKLRTAAGWKAEHAPAFEDEEGKGIIPIAG